MQSPLNTYESLKYLVRVCVYNFLKEVVDQPSTSKASTYNCVREFRNHSPYHKPQISHQKINIDQQISEAENSVLKQQIEVNLL